MPRPPKTYSTRCCSFLGRDAAAVQRQEGFLSPQGRRMTPPPCWTARLRGQRRRVTRLGTVSVRRGTWQWRQGRHPITAADSTAASPHTGRRSRRALTPALQAGQQAASEGVPGLPHQKPGTDPNARCQASGWGCRGQRLTSNQSLKGRRTTGQGTRTLARAADRYPHSTKDEKHAGSRARPEEPHPLVPLAQGKDGIHRFHPVTLVWFCSFVFQISKATVCW